MKGIHLTEAQPEDLKYSFSDFHHPNQYATVHKNNLKQAIAFYGPKSSKKGIKSALSGANFDAQHLKTFLESNKAIHTAQNMEISDLS